MNAAARPRFLKWWLPSLGVCIWLMYFFAVQLSDHRQFLISTDGGACLHWRIGNWMIAHHTVLRVDPFSFTKPDAPVISKEWLSEVIQAAVANHFGWSGVLFLAATLIATCLWLLHRMLLAEGCDVLLATGLVLLAAASCSMHWLARPLLVTHLFTLIFNWQLRDFDRGRVSAGRLAVWLVPLMMLWANLHGAFPTGFLVIACYVVGNAIARRWRATAILSGVGAACLLATLVNPNGWRLHEIILHYLRSHALVDQVDEFLSPNFHSEMLRGFLLQLALLAVVLLIVRPRWSATDLLLTGGWAYSALYSARNVPIFAIIVTPILAEHLNAFLRARPDSTLQRAYRKISADIAAIQQASDGRALVAVAVAVMVVALDRRLVVTELLPSRFPVAAVKFLETKPALADARIFNPDFWGGYLMLAMPERKVFLDDRHEFYGEAMIREYQVTAGLSPRWTETLKKYDIALTVLPVEHPLNQLLALEPHWRRIYADAVTAMFLKTP